MGLCRRLCFLALVLATNMALSSDVMTSALSNAGGKVIRSKRHTPFLPGDYWKDKRPEFGDTDTDLQVMVNATARLKCPITHVADSSVSLIPLLKTSIFLHFQSLQKLLKGALQSLFNHKTQARFLKGKLP